MGWPGPRKLVEVTAVLVEGASERRRERGRGTVARASPARRGSGDAGGLGRDDVGARGEALREKIAGASRCQWGGIITVMRRRPGPAAWRSGGLGHRGMPPGLPDGTAAAWQPGPFRELETAGAGVTARQSRLSFKFRLAFCCDGPMITQAQTRDSDQVTRPEEGVRLCQAATVRRDRGKMRPWHAGCAAIMAALPMTVTVPRHGHGDGATANLPVSDLPTGPSRLAAVHLLGRPQAATG
jgi:hypothetical protein